MWDVQERNGHYEVGTGQRPKCWKEEEKEEEEEEEDDDDDDDDDDQVWFLTLREEAVGVLEGGALGNIWAQEEGRDRRLKNRPIRQSAASQFVWN
jgi:hypothetical protein